MKKIKYLLIIIVLMFVGNLDVFAIKCEYKSNSGDNITITIDKNTLISNYTNSLGSSQPFFPMNLVDGDQTGYMFNNDRGGSGYLYNRVLVEACPNEITNYSKNNAFSSKIEVGYMASNSLLSGKSSPLTMPIIYFSSNGQTEKKETASLNTLTNGVKTSDFSSYKSIVYKLSQVNSENAPVSEDGYISCNYKGKNVTGLYNFRFKTNGDLVHQYSSNNSGNYQNIRLDSERINFTSCPSVIKLGSTSKTTFTVSSIDACYYDDPLCLYEENVSPYYGNKGTQITTYTEYANNSAPKISIYLDDSGNIKVGNGNTTNEILVNNMNLYTSIFQNKETGSYPKYLVKKGETYSFVSEKPSEFDKIYINAQSLLGIQGLGEAEIYKTCTDIFGESFLKWLDENVFIVIRIGVPILLILLTTLDFAKVVFNDDKEGMANAFNRFKKRAIAAILIFLTPTIIMLIANLVGGDELDAVTDCVNYIENMTETSN